MKNLSNFKKEITLLVIGLACVILAIFANFNPAWTQKLTSEAATATPTPTPDPSKDLISLDNFLTYQPPEAWQKTDYIDIQTGKSTFIKLTSPDFDSPQPSIIENGVGIIIDRSYDINSEETLKNKLNTNYGFDTYNVTPLNIAGKNAMTMHKDADGHHRFIYIANGNHLWEISIASKSLEDEAKYQGHIETFLASIQFKN